MARNDSTKDQVRAAAEADFETFIRLVQPDRVLGSVHQEVIRWWQTSTSTHKLTLLPRDHQKSALAALYAAWRITKNPAIRILYISSTANLATKQLKFIKDILTSRVYRMYWPEMIHTEEGKREKWTETEVSVDHPLRKAAYIRDPSVFTAGLTTNIVGMHCDVSIYDDVVTNDTAYTQEARTKLEKQFSFLASIEGTDSEALVVGTRYHPSDLYNVMMQMEVNELNEFGELTGTYMMYDKFERQVETNGEFLWPRQQGPKGSWYGFNSAILERKRAQYLDKVQFRAQYYNDPNDAESAGIFRECFQYYDRSFLKRDAGKWYYKNKPLNVFAAVDFAFSKKAKADYTAIVVVAVDGEHNYYVLDIERFKGDQPSDYFSRILKMHQKWDFRKIRCEVTAAQQVIVNDLKHSYIRPHGLALAVEDYRPNRYDGAKEERIAAVLQPRYHNRQVWHYVGGHCQTLEEELVLNNPPHDDVKDCLATVVDMCVAPTSGMRKREVQQLSFHNRFGGVY
jgi:hypothetical protein